MNVRSFYEFFQEEIGTNNARKKVCSYTFYYLKYMKKHNLLTYEITSPSYYDFNWTPRYFLYFVTFNLQKRKVNKSI